MVEWGTAGEWAAAIGTVVLLVGTYLMWQWDRRKAERRREEGERRRELAEASKVNVWYQSPYTPPEGSMYWLMVVENEGDRTIYEWDAVVSWYREEQPRSIWRMSNELNGPLPPRVRRVQKMNGLNMPPFPEDPTGVEFDVLMTWHDPATGRWWLRQGGKLQDSDSKFPVAW